MYFAKDSEYNDIREKSFCQWLDEMEKHEDVAALRRPAGTRLYGISEGRE